MRKTCGKDEGKIFAMKVLKKVRVIITLSFDSNSISHMFSIHCYIQNLDLTLRPVCDILLSALPPS